MKGFATLIALLVASLIFIILFVMVAKSPLQRTEDTTTSANPKDVQKQIDEFQKKSIENQKINVE